MNTTPRTAIQIIADSEKKAKASVGNDRMSVLAYQVGYLAACLAELESKKELN